jgi:hypothetical protein
VDNAKTYFKLSSVMMHDTTKSIKNKIIRSSGYPGFERMHCQKTLNGPGTVLNGFPSKAACKKVIKQNHVQHNHVRSNDETQADVSHLLENAQLVEGSGH